jgi:hypothetical protein
MDAFWAGLAVGFGVLLLGRVEKKSGNLFGPGLPSYRPTIAPGSSAGVASASAAGTDSCNCCGVTANVPSVVVLGTPYAPAPVSLKPATPYSGESQWYAGQGSSGPGAATWGVN